MFVDSVIPLLKAESDVDEEIKCLDSRFSELVFKAQLEIEEQVHVEIKDVNSSGRRKLLVVKKFRHHLTYLPADIRAEHYQFLKSNLDELVRADNTEQIFMYLNLYWSFLDYSLLEHIINKFGSVQLNDDMTKYATELAVFIATTTVAQFVERWPTVCGRKTIPPHFSELTVRITLSASECTLERLEKVRKDFCREFSLSTFALVLAEVQPGSVFVVWYVPSSIVPQLSSTLSDYTGNLFCIHCISTLKLDDQLFDDLLVLEEECDRVDISGGRNAGTSH